MARIFFPCLVSRLNLQLILPRLLHIKYLKMSIGVMFSRPVREKYFAILTQIKTVELALSTNECSKLILMTTNADT